MLIWKGLSKVPLLEIHISSQFIVNPFISIHDFIVIC